MNDQGNSLTALQESLGYQFQSEELFLRALTHRSAVGKESRHDYERLEFLGDAVLDLAIADMLLVAHPAAKEGELSKMRAAIVNTESLADTARALNLSSHIFVSKAEKAQNGHERPAILADVMESLFGAIYKEAGFESAEKVIRGLFTEKVATVSPNDPKTELQELLHALELPAPEYAIEHVAGPEHAPHFVSSVTVNGENLGTGEGKTKKASQQLAAQAALKVLQERSSEAPSKEEASDG